MCIVVLRLAPDILVVLNDGSYFVLEKKPFKWREVWIGLFLGLQKYTRSWCHSGTWKPLEGDTRIALRHSEKEVEEFCSAANVPTLVLIAKMKRDLLG